MEFTVDCVQTSPLPQNGGGTSVRRLNSLLMHDISNWAPKGDVMEIAGFPYKPQMYNQVGLLILVGTCKNCFVAVVSFPSISTFTDVLFESIFVLKTGSSIETWTGITSLEKNDTVEWNMKQEDIDKKERFTVILQPNRLASNEIITT